MRAIMFEVGDEAGEMYDSLGSEKMKQVTNELCELMRRIIFDERVTKLKKIIEEINNDPSGISINPEILFDLLRIEE